MQVVYIFLRIVLASILIVVLFQVARGKFLADMEKEKTVKMVLKKLFSITLQVSLFWGIWFVLCNLFSFMQWALYYNSLDFSHWWWYAMEEDPSLTMGMLIIILCFPLSFLIVKKMNIKL